MIFSNEIQSLAKKLVTEIFTDLVFVNPSNRIYNSKMAKRVATMGTDRFFMHEYSILKKIREKKEKYGIDEVCSGATRIVIIFNENSPLHGVVVKIPMGELNYCSRERKYYACAVDEKVEEYFAPIEYIGSVTIPVITTKVQIPLYLMTRAEYCQDDLYDLAAQYLGERDLGEECCVESLLDEDETYEEVDNETLINRYLDRCEGEQVVEYALAEVGIAGELYDFCYRHNINDIHEDNVGMVIDENGFACYVVIDYAGFGS